MKFLFDIFPLIVFFVAFKFYGIFPATAVAIGASVLQLVYLFLARKKIEWMVLVNIGVIVVFGGLTLFLHNELFIKWKPTIIYSIFAAGLFIAEFFFHTNLLRTMLKTAVELPEAVYKKMNYVWAFFFLSLALLNLFVAYTFPTDIWVNFKVFGLIGLTVLFVIGQSVWLARYMKTAE